MDREVAAEVLRNDRNLGPWTATGNAPNAVAAKDPAELTRDDAMTMACDAAAMAVFWGQGVTRACADAGKDDVQHVTDVATHLAVGPGRGTDALNLPLALRLLEICRDPQAASAEAVAGAWMAMLMAFLSRPSVGKALLDAGLLEVVTAHLRQTAAAEWINWRCAAGLQATGVFLLVGSLFQYELPGISDLDKAQLLVENGFAEIAIESLKVSRLPTFLALKRAC